MHTGNVGLCFVGSHSFSETSKSWVHQNLDILRNKEDHCCVISVRLTWLISARNTSRNGSHALCEFHSGEICQSIRTARNCLKSGYRVSFQKRKQGSLKISCFYSEKKINGLRTGNRKNNSYILDVTAVTNTTCISHEIQITALYLFRGPKHLTLRVLFKSSYQ